MLSPGRSGPSARSLGGKMAPRFPQALILSSLVIPFIGADADLTCDTNLVFELTDITVRPWELFSSRRKEVVVGALSGFAIALLFVHGNSLSDAIMRNVGLNIGGIIGATCWPIIQVFAIVVHKLGNWLSPQASLGQTKNNSVTRSESQLA